MKKIVFSCLVLLLPGYLTAQDIDYKDHRWEDAAIQPLSDTEKQEPALILKDKRVIEYYKDEKDGYSYYYTRHKRIHINEEKSIEEYNKIYLPVSSMEDLVSLKARTITPGGAVKELDKSHTKEITEEGQKYLILAIEGLEKGAELEYFYTYRRGVSYFGTEYLQSGVFTKNMELVIIAPESMTFEAASYNGFPTLTDTVINGKRYLQAICKVVPAKNQDEQYAFYDANLMRVEYKLSYAAEYEKTRLFTWNEAGKRFYSLLHEFEEGSEKDLRSISSKLKLKNKPEEEKIRSIEAFIKGTISLQEDAPDEPISLVLKKKYAGEFSLLGLYALLFEHNNIMYELVCTSNRYKRSFDSKFDTWNYLSEELFYFPGTGKYLDPSDLGHRYGLPPYQNAPGEGLFIKGITIGGIKSAVSTIRKIEAASVDQSADNMKAIVTFPAQMDVIQVNVSKKMTGYPASNLRPYYFYSSEEDRKKIAESVLNLGIEDATVQNIKVSNFDLNAGEADKEFVVEGDVKIGSLLEKASDTYLLKVGEVIGKQVEMYQEKERQNPVEIGFNHSYDREIRVKIPDGYSIQGLESLRLNITHEEQGRKVMGFISDYEMQDKELVIRVKEYYNDLYYPLSIFDKYRQVINAAADFNKITLVLVKAS